MGVSGLVSQENAGVSAARNRGAAEAKSELVAFLDADDQWLPDFLETVLRLRDRFPQASVWATAYAAVGENGEPLRPEFPGTAVVNAEGGLIDYFQSPGPWMPVHASAVMLRKDALVKAGGFPIDMRCGEDWDTWIRLALRFPIAWSPKTKAMLHQDAENRTDGWCYTGVLPYFRQPARVSSRGRSWCSHIRARLSARSVVSNAIAHGQLAGRRPPSREEHSGRLPGDQGNPDEVLDVALFVLCSALRCGGRMEAAPAFGRPPRQVADIPRLPSAAASSPRRPRIRQRSDGEREYGKSNIICAAFVNNKQRENYARGSRAIPGMSQVQG